MTFSVIASGTEPFSYQWRKGKESIENANFSTLTIEWVEVGDAGAYSVVVSNSAGEVISPEARLSVNVPPAITAHPVTTTGSHGSVAIFSVTVSGTPPFTFQWAKDGKELPGETSATLAVADLEAGDVGSYSVTVRNAAGEITSQQARLSLLDIDLFPGLTIFGAAGARYRIEYADKLDAQTWIVLTELVLPGSPHTFSDYSAPKGFRFYRATLIE